MIVFPLELRMISRKIFIIPSLTIRSCSNFLDASSAVRPALLQLPNLQYFDVGDAGPAAIELLLAMTIPLKGLVLCWDLETDSEPDVSQSAIIQHFASSLTEFALSYGIIEEMNTCFPRIKTLRLEPFIYIDIFRVASLFYDFPNVERLRLSVSNPSETLAAELMEEIREENDEEFRDASNIWPNLDFLSGDCQLIQPGVPTTRPLPRLRFILPRIKRKVLQGVAGYPTCLS